MDINSDILFPSHGLFDRAGGSDPNAPERPPVYKAVGISLAIASGVFIGTSFVLKKSGLLKSNVKYAQEAGEGYGYLRSAWWWSGMTLMIVGEICNFVAYAFVDAILVTPMGALSVVIATILSAIFLKERLSFVGKVGCFNCIIGAVVIGVNAPSQSSVSTIQEMKDYVIAPGFLTYTGLVIVSCLFIALWAGPRYGKKTMMVYISICSLVGGLSVVATQGLGAAVLAQARGEAQFNYWFLYVLLVFVIATLLVEIVYLNKALNIFNAALVTPTYYVFFTSATIITSAILFKGFKGSTIAILTLVMGFFQICSGVVLLQLSKSAKDVPDTAVFTGDLDQVRTVAEQHEPESEPKADAIRGTAAIIRRISVSRQKWEAEEAKRYHEERIKEMEPIGEDETFEWDGLRRRRTSVSGSPAGHHLKRRKTLHPPLGLTHFPEESEDSQPGLEEEDPRRSHDEESGMLGNIRKKARSVFVPSKPTHLQEGTVRARPPTHPVPMTSVTVRGRNTEPTAIDPHFSENSQAMSPALAASLQQPRQSTKSGSSSGISPGHVTPIRLVTDNSPQHPPVPAKRQFSFQNLFTRHNDHHQTHDGANDPLPAPRKGLHSRQSSHTAKAATEEEQLGLVKGDSTSQLPNYASDDEWQVEEKPKASLSESALSPSDEKEEDIGRLSRLSRSTTQLPSERQSNEEWEKARKD
ncbi:MAG: hypothetical protein M1833_005711 [Piccolia ochrophora]|nr:MAG: hypothetical protein M1833_005711 [Piccolia ochrophora]